MAKVTISSYIARVTLDQLSDQFIEDTLSSISLSTTATWKTSNSHVAIFYSPRGRETFPPKFCFSPTWRIFVSQRAIWDFLRRDFRLSAQKRCVPKEHCRDSQEKLNLIRSPSDQNGEDSFFVSKVGCVSFPLLAVFRFQSWLKSESFRVLHMSK